METIKYFDMATVINILLVEDDEVDVMNVKRAFKKNNINNPLFVANNGREALDALWGKNPLLIIPSPRIVLIDINMPKMGGIEFLGELRQDPELRGTSVFVMSTSNEESDKIAAYDLNVAGYILKPLSFEGFTSAVAILNHYWHLCEMPQN
jgi:CheY-like chemotaxis protein